MLSGHFLYFHKLHFLLSADFLRRKDMLIGLTKERPT